MATDSQPAKNPDSTDVDSKARAVFERGVVAVRHSIVSFVLVCYYALL